MTPQDDFERSLAAWFASDAPVRAPEHVAEEAVTRVATTNRRPGWLIAERWFSMQTTMRLAAVPRAVTYALVIAIVAIALVAAALLVGSRRQVPAPFGLARPGLIAYASNNEVVVSNVDGNARRVLVSDAGIDTQPTWSLDGTRLAYFFQRAENGPADLVVVDADGGNRRTIAAGLDPSAVGYWGPAWSPDGGQLAYAWSPSQFQQEDVSIVVVSAAGGGPRTVVTNAPLGAHPVWSPDSRTLAYRGGTAADGYGVFVVPADGSSLPRRISHVPGGEGAFTYTVWSPDGEHLATNAGGSSQFSIEILDASGAGEHRLTTGDASEMFPAWSPTGTRLAYGQMAGTDAQGIPTLQLAVASPDGSHIVDLNAPPVSAAEPIWAPDESALLAAAPEGSGLKWLLIDPTAARAPVEVPEGGDWQRTAP